MFSFFIKRKKQVMSFIIVIMVFTFLASLVPQVMFLLK
jgi:hypothetical protein